MFDRTTTIAAALKARPELRELLPAFHPAFARLKHPVLGRVLPRLVTVEDAARIAGVDPDVLLSVMNLPGAPADIHPVAPPPGPAAPPPPWLDGVTPRVLDVRPALARGDEPFGEIMAALRALPRGEVLLVLAPFEPAPLIRLLDRQGWLHHVAWESADEDDAGGDRDAAARSLGPGVGGRRTCRLALLFPPGGGASAEAGGPGGTPATPELGEHLSAGEGGYVLDVRALEPPDPMRLALEAVDAGKLPLVLWHRREPVLLMPRLAERGLRAEVTTDGGEVKVRISRP